MRHLNSSSLSLLETIESSGVDFGGTVPDCDVRAVGKRNQLAHPKTANNKRQRTFQLIMTDLMGPSMPEAVGGLKYVCKISNEYTRWTKIYLLETKDGALHEFLSFIQSMVILGRVRVERLRADKGAEYIGNDFRTCCRKIGISLEFVSTNTPQQIGQSERVGRRLAAMVRCMLTDSGVP
ncbi:unnamed protein product, partial [Sphacelaria rigidula]